jgi:hypothetical protein
MSTYSKPKNVSYTEMAMFFDKHIKKPKRDDNLLYEYVYHIVYMLANKSKYFHDYQDYDEFSLYAANKIYMRAINEDKQEKPIKSILNYIKAVIYPLKVDYQKETYDEIINPEVDDRINGEKLKNNLHAPILADYREGLMEELYQQLTFLPKYIREVVEESPYKNDVITSRRLYMSVLLSFLNGVTLTNQGLQKLKRREIKSLETDNTTIKMLEKEKETSTLLWRLDDSLLNYVEMLTNKVRKKFGRDLVEIKKSHELPEEDLKAIMMSAYNTDQNDNNEEM